MIGLINNWARLCTSDLCDSGSHFRPSNLFFPVERGKGIEDCVG